MTITYEQAIDEIYATFFDQWKVATSPIVGYIPKVEWWGVESPSKPDKSKFWARVSQQTVIEQQTTLSTCEGEPGQKRFTTSGLVFVQIFCPKSAASSAANGRKLAKVARNAYRGKSTPGGVWFRNARIQELDPEELYYRFNVVAEYEYDELG